MKDDPFSIGADLDAYDRQRYLQAEAERDERPVPDALDSYTALLATGNHPPQECGDPSDCPAHAEMWQAYYDGLEA